MNYRAHMLELAQKRERLLARCDFQREELQQFVVHSQRAFDAADRVVRVVRFFRAHPMALAGTVAVFALVQRRGWWGWMKRALFAWRAYRTIRQSWAKPAI